MKIPAILTAALAIMLGTGLAPGDIVIKAGDSIAFMGDSLTQLGNLQKPNGYVNLVIEGLQAAGVTATPIPAGVGGNTTRDMLARLDKDVIAKKPTWMTLNSGINDSPRMDLEEFRANLTRIVDQATAAGIKVILITTTIGAGENLESTETLKRGTFAEAFRQLGKERHLLVVDMNTVMARELTERQKDGVKGLKLTYDGTHLNGLGNQIFAAEILRTLGVPEAQVAASRSRWNDYPFAVGMPELSVNDAIRLKALADKNGKTLEEQVSAVLTNSPPLAGQPQPAGKLKVMQCWDDSLTTDIPMIELLKKHHAKATFNLIPMKERRSFMVKKLKPDKDTAFSFMPAGTQDGFKVEHLANSEMKAVYQGFTVAAHCGFSNAETPEAVEPRRRVLVETLAWIKSEFGQDQVGFVYPGGGYNDTVMQAVQDAGYLYGRTTKSAAAPFPLDHPMELRTSCKWDSTEFWQRYEDAKRHGGRFYFWGHSCELGNDPNLWAKLESIYARISADPEAEWIDPIDLFKPAGKPIRTTPTVQVNGGRISGQTNATGDIHAFKGIPFSAPPVGDLRWKEPQPVAPWSGVKACDAFAASPMQGSPANFGPWTAEFLIPKEPISEDCLYLNVWTGAKTPTEKRPVIVWIHGGGLNSGGAGVPIYDGEAMAKKGIVFVSLNYRVGIFGFFAHPELTRESPNHASGNYGLLDQMAGLKWVQQNIAAFGGDPKNVTVAGQSAGAWCVNCLVASPLCKGLFIKAIAESGALFIGSRKITTTLAQAEEAGVITGGSLAELRAIPAASLLGKPYSARCIIIDGYVLPRGLKDIFDEGKQNDVALLTGWNEDDGVSTGKAKTAAEFKRQAEQKYGANAAKFLQSYPANTDEEAAAAQAHLSRDETFGLENYTWANIQAEKSVFKVYLYRFTRKLPATGDYVKYGSFHTGEVAYAYDNLRFINRCQWEDVDHRLAEVMSAYWANFAATGNPNGQGLPEWPAYNTKSNTTMILGETLQAKPLPGKNGLEFLTERK